jgi:hypothetical protein
VLPARGRLQLVVPVAGRSTGGVLENDEPFQYSPVVSRRTLTATDATLPSGSLAVPQMAIEQPAFQEAVLYRAPCTGKVTAPVGRCRLPCWWCVRIWAGVSASS